MIFPLVIHQCAVREAAVQNNCKPVATAVGKYRIDIIGQMKTGKEKINESRGIVNPQKKTKRKKCAEPVIEQVVVNAEPIGEKPVEEE